MAFIETPRFPDDISYGGIGGPEFMTDVAPLKSGHEQRNSNWEVARAQFDVSHGVRSQEQMETLVSFFRAVRGKAHGFRFKDWTDYKTYSGSNDGWLGSSKTGAGASDYTMSKYYKAGDLDYLREITKPVSGTSTIYRNGSPVTVGSAAGQVVIFANSGVARFAADLSIAIGSITNASPGVVVASAHTFSTSNQILLSGAGGMTQVNSAIFAISVLDANRFSIGVDTTSYGIYTSGGTAKRFAQNSESLTWVGEFDVPCRFDIDKFRGRLDFQNVLAWDSIPIIELKIGSASA
jgi:uncharacterized protein (TIGR02217 family)